MVVDCGCVCNVSNVGYMVFEGKVFLVFEIWFFEYFRFFDLVVFYCGVR